MSRPTSELTELLALVAKAKHSKFNDDGGQLTIVPPLTYCVKKFAPGSRDIVHITDLIDCVGVIITDRKSYTVAAAHFHPLNCFAKEVTKISLEKIKAEFIGAGANLSDSKVRIVGGGDPRLRNTVNLACQESLAGVAQIASEGFLNRTGHIDATHAILDSARSYVATIENSTGADLKDSSIIKKGVFKVVEALGATTESEAQREDLFFEKCSLVVRSQEQKLFKAKPGFIIKKIAKDLGLVGAGLSIDPAKQGSAEGFRVTPDLYELLIQQEEKERMGSHVAKTLAEKGCVLDSVDEFLAYTTDRSASSEGRK